MRKIKKVLIVVYFLRAVVLPVVEVMMWMRDKAEIYELSSSCDMCVEDVSMCFERERCRSRRAQKHGKLSPPIQ